MRYENALESILPKMKNVNGVVAIFLKGSIARGENDAYSDLDLYVMLKHDVMVETVYGDIVKALEAYRKLLYKDLIEIICPQIIGVYTDMLHIDCYIVYENDYPQTDVIKVLYDPGHRLNHYKEQDLRLTTEMFNDSAIDSCWFIYQYDHIAERGQHLWTTQMIDNALNHVTKVLLYKYYPEKSLLGKKAAHHLPSEIYETLVKVNDLNNSRSHRETVSVFMNLYKNEIKSIVEMEWDQGFEDIFNYLYEKYA
ncbi:nucleotidyltransferase domain-containing protein [Mammaliicoccus sp. Dog046]|uniref:nucleotidyltransferase domain-containing protein n=1 Tax=Mammaliicoccus sp. Dog046 TaxID=3034233 RepID=UPI002B25B15C|nr:nucleotidyltransferase domain-containing protein [Mammaliicoccus sp. Dog046]WQK85378.1 nucleotidyltransferase domain-containing protein [Mammaliicoccus sp. Dog046]